MFYSKVRCCILRRSFIGNLNCVLIPIFIQLCLEISRDNLKPISFHLICTYLKKKFACLFLGSLFCHSDSPTIFEIFWICLCRYWIEFWSLSVKVFQKIHVTRTFPFSCCNLAVHKISKTNYLLFLFLIMKSDFDDRDVNKTTR